MQKNERSRRYEGKKQHDYELSGTISKLSFLKHKPICSWHEIGLIGKNKVA